MSSTNALLIVFIAAVIVFMLVRQLGERQVTFLYIVALPVLLGYVAVTHMISFPGMHPTLSSLYYASMFIGFLPGLLVGAYSGFVCDRLRFDASRRQVLVRMDARSTAIWTALLVLRVIAAIITYSPLATQAPDLALLATAISWLFLGNISAERLGVWWRSQQLSLPRA